MISSKSKGLNGASSAPVDAGGARRAPETAGSQCVQAQRTSQRVAAAMGPGN